MQLYCMKGWSTEGPCITKQTNKHMLEHTENMVREKITSTVTPLTRYVPFHSRRKKPMIKAEPTEVKEICA